MMQRIIVLCFLFCSFNSLADQCSDIWQNAVNQQSSAQPNTLQSNSSSPLTVNDNGSTSLSRSDNTFVRGDVTVGERATLTFNATGGGTVVLYATKLEVKERGTIAVSGGGNLVVITENDIVFDKFAVGTGLFYSATKVQLKGSGDGNKAEITGSVSAPEIQQERSGQHVTFDSSSLSSFDLSGICEGGGSATNPTYTFADFFDSQAYDNQDGIENWLSDWQEISDNGSPFGGEVYISGGELVINDDPNGAYRTLDLSAYGMATLSYDYRIEDTVGGSEFFRIQISLDGSSWSTLASHKGDGSSGSESINLDGYLEELVYLRVISEGSMENSDFLYLDNFAVDASGTPAVSTHTFFDEFSTESYSRNDGQFDFTSDWQESNDNGNPSSGDIDIVNGELHLQDDDRAITREVDLSSYGNAILSFDYREVSMSNSNEYVDLRVSTDGGNSWTDLNRFTGDQDSDSSFSIDISDYISSETQIQFLTSGNMGNGDDFYVDNFAIDASGIPLVPAHTFFDKFSTESYGRNDGQLDFTNNWQESNDDDDPSDGDIDIVSGELHLQDDRRSITRELDLSSFGQATLSFDYREDSMSRDDEYVDVRISTNGGSSWTRLNRFNSNTDTDSSYSVDISGYLSAQTQIQFLTSGDMGNSDDFYVDNFAIDASGTPVSCADTSGYSTVFSDDFSTTDKTWNVVNFVKTGSGSLNLWPGESIYITSNQEQDLLYEISGGKLNIADTPGDDNEYGALLHNISEENYNEESPNQYSVSTVLTSRESENFNNDVGLVFGYQDHDNFYLARWTKYAASYVSDTRFPGVHRSFDLIKVSSGVVTILQSKQLSVSDDIDLGVTVNNDGISVCVNSTLFMAQADEQPNLHQVGVYSYDNDDGVSFDNFEIVCADCEEQLVDHYRVLHDGAGITCAAENIEIQACANSDCTNVIEAFVSATLTSTGSQVPTGFSYDSAPSSSTTSVSLNQDTAEIITLGLQDMSQTATGSPAVRCFNTQTNVESCEMTFVDFGFIVEVSDFIARSDDNANKVGGTIQAVKSVAGVGGDNVCEADLVGEKTVQIGVNYNLIGFSAPHQLQISTDSGSEYPNAAGLSLPLDFNVTNATVPFYLAYENVGQITLSVTDSNNSSITGSDTFIVYPDALQVLVQDSGGQDLANFASGNGYVAGNDFNFTIRSVNLDGNVITNYSPGALQINPSFAPGMTGLPSGVSDVNFHYTYLDNLSVSQTKTVTAKESDTWDDFGGVFTNGMLSSTQARFDDVGEFEINVRDNNFFGYSIVTENAAATFAGRFTPAYFEILEVTTPEIDETNDDFSYFGEQLTFTGVPEFQIIARNALGGVTFNYDDKYFSLNLNQFEYTDNNINVMGFDPGTLNVTSSDNEDWDGIVEIQLNGSFSYTKTSTLYQPFNVDLNLNLYSNSPTNINDRVLADGDGIAYDATPLNNITLNNSELNTDAFIVNSITGTELRYGRIRLENAFGPEEEPLKVEMKTEYWNGTNFILNIDDTMTSFASYQGVLTGGASAQYEAVIQPDSGTRLFFEGVAPSGQGLFIQVADDGTATSSELKLELTDFQEHLKFDWNGDDTIDSDDEVTSNILLGRYRGNDRIIYKRIN